MSQTTVHTRRKFIGALGAAPFALSGASLLSLSACGGGGSTAASSAVASIAFNTMSAPSAVADQAAVITNATIDITYSDGSKKLAQALGYKALYKTGDSLTSPAGDTVIAGGYYYPDGVTPIIDLSTSTASQFYSDCPDGTSLIKLANPTVSGITGNPLFLVTQFEYKSYNNAGASMYGLLPSPIGIATLQQDKTTGELSTKYYYNVPTQDVHGLWITCAASISPWNTHLSSEEYPPDAWVIDNNTAGATLTQFQTFSTNTFGSTTAAKPYHYGHVPEVTVLPDGTGTIKKHYCLGRLSRELVQVMPDKRTVLMGDDATSGGIFMFIADVAGVLSSGTLYAAVITQTSAAGATDGGVFTMTWVKLGSANSIEIEALANTLKATDIMDVKTVDPSDATYTKINFGTGQQWVKIKTGMDKAAAFLETERYAAIKGATMEFTKLEGVTVNIKDKKAYFAMSAIKDTMTANGFVSDVIKLTAIKAGGTYEAVLGTDATIGSDWVPKSMSVPSALLGADITVDANGNTAAVDKIANTDNVKYSEAMRTLFIGEDSGAHLNNYVWAYNVDSKILSRILSVPAGAECVCLNPIDDLNGFSYVMSGFQHPGDWSFTTPAQDALKAAVKANWGNNNKAAVGYITGIPKIG